MKIREATEADTPRLINMACRFLLESRYGVLFDNQATPASIGVLVANVMSLGVILVAEDYKRYSVGETFGQETCISNDKEIVGMLAIVAIPHPLTGVKYADEVAWWVEPEHRGGLLGPKMLRAAEDWATSQGANMVKMVAPAGTDVGKFLEAVGYQAVETAFIKSI